MKNRWFEGSEAVDNEAHHTKLDGWSSSQLKVLLDEGAATFCAKYITKTKPAEEKENKNFEIGTIIHEAILEPEKYEKNKVLVSANQRVKKKGEDEVAEEGADEVAEEGAKKRKTKKPSSTLIIEPHQHVVTPKIAYIIDQVRINISKNPFLSELFSDGVAEISGVAESKGLKYKIRPDIRHPEYIVDLKTTTFSIRPYTTVTTIISCYYMLQAVFYLNVAALIDGKNAPKKFIWLFIHKGTGEIVPISLSQEMKTAGIELLRAALVKLRTGLETNKWPAKFENSGVLELSLPHYFKVEDYI
jgi:hypothetical protein